MPTVLELTMRSSAVIPFPRPGADLPEAVTFTRLAGESRTTALRGLYEAAIGGSALALDPDLALKRTFDQDGAIRLAAVHSAPGRDDPSVPVAFALAVPVASLQELAEALCVNRMDAHVGVTLGRESCYALLLAVRHDWRRRGIGRAIANRALDDIRAVDGGRAYLAVRARDHWLNSQLLGLEFHRDGVTDEPVPRVLLSRRVSFVF